MRLTTVRHSGRTSAARIEGEELVRLPFPDVSALLQADDWRSAAMTRGERTPLDDAVLARTVNPGKTLCVGLNYRSHIQETGRPVPTHPTLFGKFQDTLVGPLDDIVLPGESEQVDWEVELGVVIGAVTRKVSPEQARACIAGYTVVNDVSMRDWQSRTTQWMQGKNFEATTPLGPCVVTADEVDDASDLTIRCSIDDETMQEGRTSDLLFGPADLVSYISQFTTLRPGDLIATGTPGGVGMTRSPQRFLRAGNVLRSEIEGIGVLSNRIAEA